MTAKKEKSSDKTIFESPYQLLSSDGTAKEKELPKISNKEHLSMYQWMLTIRRFDEKALLLQRQGKLGTYAPMLGQEACQVATAIQLQKEDWIFPTYRDSGAMMIHGVPMESLLQYWNGDEFGQQFPKDVNVFPISIPLASQIIHAVGCAWSANIQGKKYATLTFFGDGATSQGDFHEGMNFAAVYNAPTILFCENNHWAISTPRSVQTKSKTIAQKAAAYGMQGIYVDGNDILAIYKVMKDALKKAKDGKGPTLIEAVTYRMSVHTTSDDPKKYRSESEVKQWAKKDPIDRYKKYLMKKKILDDNLNDKLTKEADNQVQQAIKKVDKLQNPDPLQMFEHVFKEMPQYLKEQQLYLEGMLHEKENDTNNSN